MKTHRLVADAAGLLLCLVLSGCADLSTVYPADQTRQVPAATYSSVPNDRVMTTHRVRAGESLDDIARGYGVTVEELTRWNPLANSVLHDGEVIRVYPRSGGGAPTPEQLMASTPLVEQTRIDQASAIPATRYTCEGLSRQRAYALLSQGHAYLDRDGDGHPCEWDTKRTYTHAKTTSKSCHSVSGYYRKNGTYVRGHQRCR